MRKRMSPRLQASDQFELAGGGLARALVALEFERQLLAFAQRADAGALDGRDVHEHVRAALVRLDEAEAFFGIEPLYSSGLHDRPFPDMGFPRPKWMRDQIFGEGLSEFPNRKFNFRRKRQASLSDI